MKKSTFITFILFLSILIDSGFAAKAKKAKKEKKSKQKTEIIKDEISDDLLFDDTEIITREQIDSMFSLANQLNADIYSALEAEDEDEKEELSRIIADEKARLDSSLPALKKASEWTDEDSEKLNKIMTEYKSLSKKYKTRK